MTAIFLQVTELKIRNGKSKIPKDCCECGWRVGGHCGISLAHVGSLVSLCANFTGRCLPVPALGPSPTSFPAASGCLTFPRQGPINQTPEQVVGGHIPGWGVFLPWTLADVLLQFSVQFLVFTAPTRAPRKLRDLFVSPLLTKAASVRPEKEHAGTPALPLGELLWVLSKDFGTEDK